MCMQKFVNFYQTIRCDITEHSILHQQRSEDLQISIFNFVYVENQNFWDTTRCILICCCPAFRRNGLSLLSAKK